MTRNKMGFAVAAAFIGAVTAGCAGMGGSGGQAARQPTLVVATPVAQLSPGGKIAMYGTGFAPKQEIMIVLKDPGGGLSGISGSVAPPSPVANADGVWAAEWTYTAYLRNLSPGTGLISVVDPDFKTLAQAPVLFVAPPKPKPEAAPKPEAKPVPKPAAR